MVWSPLAGGFITGKYRRGQESPEGSRRTTFDFPPIDKERGYDLVDKLDALAQAKGSTIPRLALSWVLHQRGITSVIIGARSPSQLEDNLKALEWEMSEEEVARLDELRASAVEHRNAALLDAGRHTEVIGELRDAAPYAYQEIEGERIEVEARDGGLQLERKKNLTRRQSKALKAALEVLKTANFIVHEVYLGCFS